MNIFYLERTPEGCAVALHDLHLRKMPLETAQMLNVGMPEHLKFYRNTESQLRHPCTLWICRSKSNYQFGLNLLSAMCQEYLLRFGNRYMAMELYHSYITNRLAENAFSLPDTGFSDPPKAMPTVFHMEDVVESYRYYYRIMKQFSSWTKRNKPTWL